MNEIDYWNDIQQLEKLIKKAETTEEQELLQQELELLTREFIEQYPELK